MYKIFENNTLSIIIYILIVIIYILIMIFSILKYVHIFQLNNYNLDQQIIWYKKNKKIFIPNLLLLCTTLYSIISKTNSPILSYIITVLLLALLIINFPRKQKKKLVFTNRIKRLIVICNILFLLLLLPAFANKNMAAYYLVIEIALSPLIIFISFLISLPIENSIRQRFMNEAHNIISKNDNLYVIGITGSFGKTSVKYYLNSVLREKYAVCMTPESYNTPMGATLTIKNDLKNIDDIFICEMGARRVGDIKEICDIVNPIGGIITDVGNMHLDTFNNIENVAKTKFELFDSIISNTSQNPKIGNGIILLNGDNQLIRQKASEHKEKGGYNNKLLYYYGMNDNNDFYATDIKIDDKGSKFKLLIKTDKIGKKEIAFETKLLGIYNIMNLVAAIAYGVLLNVDVDNLVEAVKKIEPVAHRLQILKYDANTILIDDAYNSNLSGAKNASDVISKFDGYTKIIITPGMVELGNIQDSINKEFAEYASKLVDYAIVVGKTNKTSLGEGFNKGLSGDNLIFVDKVEVAISYALNYISGKKVILLENDLSDNY